MVVNKAIWNSFIGGKVSNKMVGMKVECLLHSDRNKFRQGTIIAVGKETIFVKYEANAYNKEEVVEYLKIYLGKELRIMKLK